MATKKPTEFHLAKAIEAEIGRPDCDWRTVRDVADLITRIERKARLPWVDVRELGQEADTFLHGAFARLQAEIDAEVDDEDEPQSLFGEERTS